MRRLTFSEFLAERRGSRWPLRGEVPDEGSMEAFTAVFFEAVRDWLDQSPHMIIEDDQ